MDLYEDVMTIKLMVQDVIAIGQNKEDCVLREGADIASLMTSVIGFVETNLQVDVTSKLAKNQNLRVGLEFLTKGLEAMANPSADTLVALIPTGAIANLGVSDQTIGLMKTTVRNVLEGKSPLHGITTNQFAGALFAEIDTFADAAGAGEIVDKIMGFAKKLGKNPQTVQFIEFMKQIGDAPPSEAAFQQFIQGLPKQLTNVGKGMLGTFLAGMGNTPVVQKLRTVAGTVGKFLPFVKNLETYLNAISLGQQPDFADLEKFVRGLPTTVSVAKGRVGTFIKLLKGQPPTIAGIMDLIDMFELMNPGVDSISAFLQKIKSLAGSDLAAGIQEFLQKLPGVKLGGILKDLGSGKLPSAEQLEMLMGLLPDSLTNVAVGKIDTFVASLTSKPAAVKILGLMKTLGIQEPSTKQVLGFFAGLATGQKSIPTAEDLKDFAVSLMPKLGQLAMGQIGVFVGELGGKSPTLAKLTSLLQRMGKDVFLRDGGSSLLAGPVKDILSGFLKDLDGGIPTVQDMSKLVQQIPSVLKSVAKDKLISFATGLMKGSTGDKIKALATKLGRVIPDSGDAAKMLAQLSAGKIPDLASKSQLLFSFSSFLTSLPLLSNWLANNIWM